MLVPVKVLLPARVGYFVKSGAGPVGPVAPVGPTEPVLPLGP